MTNTASTRHRGHPITVAAREIEDLLDELIEQSTWSMQDEETRAALTRLTRAEARVAELKLRVAAHGEKNKIGDDTGASNTANWWAHATKATRAATHRDVKLAKALDADVHEPVRRALAAGEVLVDQAAVIVRAVDALPDDAEAWVAPKAQEWLLDQAAHHDAKTLRILGKRILEVVDPAAADAHEAKLLEQEEQAAEAAAMFRMHDDGHGKCHGKFTISSRHGAILKKALLAKAAPKHQAAVTGHAPEPGQPTAHRMGQAFQEYIESYPADALPKAGGVNATVVVTMTLETLLGGLKAARLDTGEKVTAAEARRMACAAGVIPAVLDGKSKVLDLGRKRRFHSEAQRIVATIEQGGCTAEGCDWPPGMCHMHHPEPWSRGGGTNRDGRLLCPRHHTLAHDIRYEMTLHPTGKVSFHRRR
jgi:hypothetical protein